MLEIQNELKDLRQKVQNAEEDLKKDESVAKLEVEGLTLTHLLTHLLTHSCIYSLTRVQLLGLTTKEQD
jgi:hypothetical protein